MELFLVNKTRTFSNMLRDFFNKHGYGSEKVNRLIFPEETLSVPVTLCFAEGVTAVPHS
jgi:hypothetical protein